MACKEPQESSDGVNRWRFRRNWFAVCRDASRFAIGVGTELVTGEIDKDGNAKGGAWERRHNLHTSLESQRDRRRSLAHMG